MIKNDTPIKNPVKLTNTIFRPFGQQDTKEEVKEETKPVKSESIFQENLKYPPKSDYPMAKVVKPSPPKAAEKVDPKNYQPPNYKTIMCRRYEQFNKCTYIGCTYAHG